MVQLLQSYLYERQVAHPNDTVHLRGGWWDVEH
jgi:hypothetical protein